MRALVLALVLAVGAAPPVADAKLRAKVHKKVKRHGSKRWKHLAFVLAQAPAAGPTTAAPEAPSATPAPTATPVATPKPPSLPAPSGKSVSVRSTEFAFTLSSSTVTAGSVRIELDNSAAEDPHDLEVDDPDGSEVITFGRVAAGEVTSRTVTLGPGDHVLLCPIPTHADLGMKATLHVTG